MSLFVVSTAVAEETTREQNEAAWTVDDFTYGQLEYETKNYGLKVYGCDYSREFTIDGQSVTGFSASGEAKLKAGNKNLKLPRTDKDGNVLVGVSKDAFKEKGLESVTFPTGMKVDYEDELTKNVTRRGNYVISSSAFSKNNLTELNLPDGVLVVGPEAFFKNQITRVTFPRTIWWIENMAFSHNRITDVVFPQTTDFQLEIHGYSFTDNYIKKLRLPDFTMAVHATIFAWNVGETDLVCTHSQADLYRTVPSSGGMVRPVGDPCGLVYMYTDNPALTDDAHHRIATVSRTTNSQHSCVQEIVTTYGAYTSDVQWLMQDFTYEEDSETYTATVTGLTDSGKAKVANNSNLEFPESSPNGYTVTAIDGDFRYEGLTSATFPTLCTRIGDNAFKGTGLKDVALNNKLQEIGANAFNGCDLSSIIMPDDITTLGEGAFANNSNLEYVSFSKNLTEIPANCFSCDEGMQNWESVSLPTGITTIGENAFKGNNFHEITIPDKVTTIGAGSFATTATLNDSCEITLNSGLVTIGENAFKNKAVSTVALPKTVTALSGTVFEKEGSNFLKTTVNVSLRKQASDTKNFVSNDYQVILFASTSKSDPANFIIEGDTVKGLSETGRAYVQKSNSLVVPSQNEDGNWLTKIADNAFANESLKEITIEDGIESIGAKAFYSSSITKLTLPSSLITIGASAFESNKLTELTIPEDLSIVAAGTFANNSLTALIIPENVKTIGESAFANNTTLASLTMAEGLEGIESKAFASCSIKTSELPTTVTTLAKDAFAGAPDVVELYTRSKDQLADKGSFYAKGDGHETTYNKLATTGWTVDDFTYGDSSLTGFSDTGKAKRGVIFDLVLPDYTMDGDPVLSIEGYVEEEHGDDGKVTVEEVPVFGSPESEVEWSHTGDLTCPKGFVTVEFPSQLQTICQSAFIYNNLTSIDLPESVTTIGETAFKGNKLEKVYLSDSVTKCGNGAFANNSITEARLSNSMTVIPEGFMSMNIWMTQIEIPNCVTEIQDTAFAGARLSSLEIPSSVAKIGRKAFHLHRISSLTIPGTVKELGESAFEGTYKAQTLKSLTIEDGVETIGDRCFKEGLLTDVTVPTSVTSWGKKVFENNIGMDPDAGDYRVRAKVFNEEQLKFQFYTENGKEVDDDTVYFYYEAPVVKYTVKFDANGGVLAAGTVDQTVEQGKMVTKPGEPTRDGYAFAGWTTDKDGKVAYDFKTGVSANFTLFAQWTKNKEPQPGPEPDPDSQKTLPIYRLYNQYSGEHLYTTDANEVKDLVSYGWKQEDNKWRGAVTGSDERIVYRLYNPYSGDHHYTQDKNEYDSLQKIGWNGEGKSFYAAVEGEGIAVYCMFNPYVQVGTHLYTSDKTEYDALQPVGWRGEGVKFWALEG